MSELGEKKDPRFDAAVRFSQRCWDEHLAEDQDLARLDLKIAQAARILATEYQATHIYSVAAREWHYYRAQRQALMEKRYPQPTQLVGRRKEILDKRYPR